MNPEITVIVMVGFPGSGKTSWAKYYYPHYTRLDGDSLKTSKRVAAALKQALERGQNVIVDATNTTLERRKDILSTVRNQNMRIRTVCVLIQAPLNTCMERADKRYAESQNRVDGGNIKKIPPVVFYTQNSRYVAPTKEEGFDEVYVVDNSHTSTVR
jgi:bifunctional polynucleotide phosphatase/kinase